MVQRPRSDDVADVFARYASDADVTRYLSWPVHVTLEQTRAFLAFSDREWSRWPAGPYLAFSRETGQLLGGTGLAFETAERAATGYVFARDAWGKGFATEALQAMVEVARVTGVRRLYALCHVEHQPSAHVLEKCGFERERVLRKFVEFPNLSAGARCDVVCYGRSLGDDR